MLKETNDLFQEGVIHHMDPRLEQRLNLTRRHFLGRAGLGIGTVALAELLHQDLFAQIVMRSLAGEI